MIKGEVRLWTRGSYGLYGMAEVESKSLDPTDCEQSQVNGEVGEVVRAVGK